MTYEMLIAMLAAMDKTKIAGIIFDNNRKWHRDSRKTFDEQVVIKKDAGIIGIKYATVATQKVYTVWESIISVQCIIEMDNAKDVDAYWCNG